MSVGRAAVLGSALLAVLVAAAPAAPLDGPQWVGGWYPLADGEHVSVYVSTRYAEPDALARKWVSFFAALPHGSELSLLKAYVAPLDEVADMCAAVDVLGCYGGDELVTLGESAPGLLPTSSIAAHEYGHHIAAHRDNAPWQALDWGAKRWATQMNVCRRVTVGTAFPGNESADYSFNPGEAFAETYRVLVETEGTATGYAWPIVDPSFRPDAAALAALRDDVVDPWPGPTRTTLHGRFKRGTRVWTTTIATPLDGEIRVRIDVPDDVSLAAPDGTVVARSTWTSAGGKWVGYRDCGVRSLRVRVLRAGPAARFTLRLSKP